MWTVENTKARGFRPMKTKDKGFFLRNKWKMYSVTFARKHETGEKKKQGEKKWQECGRRDAIEGRVLEQKRREILCPECKIKKKKL